MRDMVEALGVWVILDTGEYAEAFLFPLDAVERWLRTGVMPRRKIRIALKNPNSVADEVNFVDILIKDPNLTPR